jgi:hypothetical protein
MNTDKQSPNMWQRADHQKKKGEKLHPTAPKGYYSKFIFDENDILIVEEWIKEDENSLAL